MHRGVLVLLVVVGILIYLGFRAKQFNNSLALGLFATAGAILLLSIAAFFGVIGGV